MKTSPTRGRTVAHMQQMLATATAMATASCSRTDVQTVTITPLPTVPASATDTAPAPPPTDLATASTSVPSPPPPDPSGYLVVDMLPAPARCLGVAASSKASGRFRRDGGNLVLDLVVTLPTGGKFAGTIFNNATSAWSGTVVSSSYRSGNTIASVRVLPVITASTSGSLGVTLAVNCGSAGVGSLAVTASFTQPPTESTSVAFTLHDY